jgi:hypothetical protein
MIIREQHDTQLARARRFDAGKAMALGDVCNIIQREREREREREKCVCVCVHLCVCVCLYMCVCEV